MPTALLAEGEREHGARLQAPLPPSGVEAECVHKVPFESAIGTKVWEGENIGGGGGGQGRIALESGRHASRNMWCIMHDSLAQLQQALPKCAHSA